MKILGIMLATTVVVFCCWIFGLFFLWRMLLATGSNTDFWAMTESLSTAIGAAIVLGAGFLAYQELTEIANNRHLEIADRLFMELNSPENIEARRWIFKNLSPSPQDGISMLTSEGREAVKRTLNSLDRVAFLTQPNWIPEKMIMPWMNPMIVKIWNKLEVYVDYEAERRNEPDYYYNVRALAQRCIVWRKVNISNSEIVWLDDAL
ncbi:MAG: DUF4760 domain-containing protein [Caldilineaceae bacterium]